MEKKIIDVQVSIDGHNILTYTTPDNQSHSKRYPRNWTQGEIMDDFMDAFRKALAETAPEASVKIKSVVRVGEA